MPYSVHVASSTPKPAWRIRLWIIECMLTCLAVALLVLIARPLSEGTRPLGLGQRYSLTQSTEPLRLTSHAPIFTTAPTTSLPFFATLGDDSFENSKRLRAQWLNQHAGWVVVILASCGLIALNVGRGISESRIKVPLIISFWCTTAYLIGALTARWNSESFGDGFKQFFADFNSESLSFSTVWLLLAAVFLIVALTNFLLLRQPNTYSFWKCTHSVASPWVFPGFLFFCGLGWIWLMDWAARGHISKQFVGMYQADSLWLALMIFTLVAAQHGHLLAGFCRFVSWLDNLSVNRLRLPNGALLLLLLLWIGFVGLMGQGNAGGGEALKLYQRHSALLAELMRVPVWLALGWILYRWVEKGQRAAQALVAMALLLLILVAGLKLNHDGGPILAQTIAVVWIFAGLILAASRRQWGNWGNWSGWTLALLTAVAGCALALWLGFIHAPASRIDAITLGFNGPLDFLSVMQWLQNAVPASGFGVGKTPWCGYAQAAGLAGQCLRSGVPDQIQSDYVAVALVAEWGWLATLVILGGLLIWLWELLRHAPDAQYEALNFGLLRQWVVMGFSVTSGVQIIVSVAGTLGKMPLTGIAIPMLSLGGASLVGVAIFAGLSVNAVHFKRVRMLKLVADNDQVGASRQNAGTSAMTGESS